MTHYSGLVPTFASYLSPGSLGGAAGRAVHGATSKAAGQHASSTSKAPQPATQRVSAVSGWAGGVENRFRALAAAEEAEDAADLLDCEMGVLEEDECLSSSGGPSKGRGAPGDASTTNAHPKKALGGEKAPRTEESESSGTGGVPTVTAGIGSAGGEGAGRGGGGRGGTFVCVSESTSMVFSLDFPHPPFLTCRLGPLGAG